MLRGSFKSPDLQQKPASGTCGKPTHVQPVGQSFLGTGVYKLQLAPPPVPSGQVVGSKRGQILCQRENKKGLIENLINNCCVQQLNIAGNV